MSDRPTKFYVYLDQEAHLVQRDKAYIDAYDPGFWGRNAAQIQTVWTLDLEDPSTLKRLLESLARQQVKAETVRMFLQSIGYDLVAGRVSKLPPK